MEKNMETVSHVLLVDDDKDCNAANEEVFRKANFSRIKSTLNGGHALVYLHQMSAMIKTSKLLVLLDLEMPIMDGLEFLKNFNQTPEFHKENILIVVQANHIDDDVKEELELLGVDYTVSKPVNFEEVNCIVKKYFSLEEQHDEVEDIDVAGAVVENEEPVKLDSRNLKRKRARAAARR
ncbi:response regulator [Cytophagaceae bacterium ABcell3]|nr:response regulator [Cytophagaceae bacterium ABcell3]